jgi:hypothetical protein
VQDFFDQNARMCLEEYHADGLRFDATARLRPDFPGKYFTAEHPPDNPRRGELRAGRSPVATPRRWGCPAGRGGQLERLLRLSVPTGSGVC